MSLLFAAGTRPAVDDVKRLFSEGLFAGKAVRIVLEPDSAEGWLELLANGLSFDLRGLVPAPACAVEPAARRYGLPAEVDLSTLEAVSLRPGPSLAGGAAMIPIVRSIMQIAAVLAGALPVCAVSWGPARVWMEPGYFARIIANWLSGGAFPALGLTAVEPVAGGAVESVGLAFFARQEVRVEPAGGESVAELAKLAVRVIDHIVREGAITQRRELRHPDGEVLVAEPAGDARLLLVRKRRA